MGRLIAKSGLIVASILVLCARPILAETVNCTPVTAIPFEITTSGVYCLTDDLSATITSGNAILISADNVVLDLNGHTLDGSGGGIATTALGIAIQGRNVVVKNGVVQRFANGVNGLPGSDGLLVEEIRADFNHGLGIGSNGPKATIRRNYIRNTIAVLANETSFGIDIRACTACTVEDNTITDVQGSGVDHTVGIFIAASSAQVLVVNNRIINSIRGIWYFSGAGRYRDNLVFNVTTPFMGGFNAGNNCC